MRMIFRIFYVSPICTILYVVFVHYVHLVNPELIFKLFHTVPPVIRIQFQYFFAPQKSQYFLIYFKQRFSFLRQKVAAMFCRQTTGAGNY